MSETQTDTETTSGGRNVRSGDLLGAVEALLNAANGKNVPAVVRVGLMALEDAARKAGWQSIETAPRDETWVLLWGKDEETPLTAQWRGNNWLTPDGIVWSEEELYAPTHWMPLPEPPNAAVQVRSDAGGTSQ